MLGKHREERKRISNEIKDIQAAKKFALESVSKVADEYNAKLYELKQ